MNHLAPKPRQRDSLADANHLRKVSETAYENSRTEQGRIASRLQGYSFGYSPTQSGSFACNAVVFTQSALVCVEQLPRAGVLGTNARIAFHVPADNDRYRAFASRTQ